MTDSNDLFDLYRDVKQLTARAEALELEGVKSVLAYASDLLVKEYHSRADNVAVEAQKLDWNTEEWPSATAVLLEMKSMILNLEKSDIKSVNENA